MAKSQLRTAGNFPVFIAAIPINRQTQPKTKSPEREIADLIPSKALKAEMSLTVQMVLIQQTPPNIRSWQYDQVCLQVIQTHAS